MKERKNQTNQEIDSTDMPQEPNHMISGIARAFPDGRAAHPEDQIGEEN